MLSILGLLTSFTICYGLDSRHIGPLQPNRSIEPKKVGFWMDRVRTFHSVKILPVKDDTVLDILVGHQCLHFKSCARPNFGFCTSEWNI
jgi:hypothetical protein